MTKYLNKKLKKLRRRYKRIKNDIKSANGSSDANDDTLQDLSMRINHVLDDLSKLKYDISSKNQDLQDEIYEQNTKLEEKINRNKELKKLQNSNKDGLVSSEGLEEQMNYNFYLKLFYMVLKIIILGGIVYIIYFMKPLSYILGITGNSTRSENKIPQIETNKINISKSKQSNDSSLMSDKLKQKSNNVTINYNNNG